MEGKGKQADGLKLHLRCCFEFVWAGGVAQAGVGGGSGGGGGRFAFLMPF